MQAEVALRDGPGSELLANLWDWDEDASERSVYLVFAELNQLAHTCLISVYQELRTKPCSPQPNLH